LRPRGCYRNFERQSQGGGFAQGFDGFAQTRNGRKAVILNR
jgi:hypothetical protein